MHFPILVEQRDDQGRPAGLMAGADAGAGVAVEVLGNGMQSRQWGSVWKYSLSPQIARRPPWAPSRRKMFDSRRARSRLPRPA